MRVKMLSRDPSDYLRETKKDIHKVPRNYDPNLHPLEVAREYTRALNATKLERVFAKPFLCSLDGHKDSVTVLRKHPKNLSLSFSGGVDGEVRLWNLAKRECIRTINAHEGLCTGIAVQPKGEYFYSCGNDKIIKQWSMDSYGLGESSVPMNSLLGKAGFQCMDHHWKDNIFATSGAEVDIWDAGRTTPMRSFTWGVDSTPCVRFNPVETHLLGATSNDRAVILYDMRGSAPLRKVILKLRSNMIAWNPMQAFNFTVANEDYNLYTFDMRNLATPVTIHMDHVLAVMDVDYSPTGKKFVSGSYDKTIRVFDVDAGRSCEIFHTKRMQRVMAVQWSMDDKYILSASDEMNLRLWKANASEKLGPLQPRERAAFEYQESLKTKFAHHPQVKRISRHRHVPKRIYTATKEIQTIRASQKRKESNRRRHSKKGAVPHVPEKKKVTVSEVK